MKTTSQICLALVFAVVSLSAYASTTVEFVPSTSTVLPGDTFSIAIKGSDFLTELDGGGFDLRFNPDVIKVNSFTINPLFELSLDPNIDQLAGSITNISFNTFSTGPKGSFSIADMSITALAFGSSPLDLVDNVKFPFGSGGNLVPVVLKDGVINVTAVPIPAALGLFNGGLLSLFGFLFAHRGKKNRTEMLAPH